MLEKIEIKHPPCRREGCERRSKFEIVDRGVSYGFWCGRHGGYTFRILVRGLENRRETTK